MYVLITFDGIFFVCNIKKEVETFPQSWQKWSYCVLPLVLLASRKVFLVEFSMNHFWNNRRSRGKTAVSISVIFCSSPEINPPQDKAVELLYTGLTVR